MAGPGGKEVARVSVRVLPDASKFGPALKAYLERVERRLRLDLPVSLNQADVAKTEAELEALTRDRSVNVDLDVQSLGADVHRATSLLTRSFGRMAALAGVVALAIGAAVAALPAALSLALAPVAAFVLGLDGIKSAASGLGKEVDRLQTSLSGTFERLLTPGFERLGKLFPVLEDGLGKVAEGVSEVFDSFASVITSSDKLATIERIFGNIAGAFQDFARLGGIDTFVDSVLALADAGTKAAKAITPDVVATFQVFNDLLEGMATNGSLQKGMEGIGHAIELALGLLGGLVIAAIGAFAVMEVTGEAIVTFFSKTVPEGVAAMKAQIVADFNALLAYLQGIPKQITGYFSHLGGLLKQIGADAVQGLWDGMKSTMTKLTSWLSQKASDILGIFSSLWDVNSPSREFRKLGQFAGEGLALGFKDSLAGVEASATLVADSGLRAARASSFDTGEIAPPAAPSPRIGKLTITNWKDGTGYFEELADGVLERSTFEAAVYA